MSGGIVYKQLVDGPIPIGEWMPDAVDCSFPNLLTANNVEPSNMVYKTFHRLNEGTMAPTGTYLRGSGVGYALDGNEYIYAATNNGIFMSLDGQTFNSRSGTASPATVDFLQFDEFMFAAQAPTFSLLYHTVGAATNFLTASSAPSGARIGKINRFLILGDVVDTDTTPHRIRWSAIDNPLSWPTPNSATAIATQAGEQYLDSEYGTVTGFASGDQFGLVFQSRAITRITYVGPPVVFQFDKISTNIGCRFPRSIVQMGGLTYFADYTGFYKTDGVSVINIGERRVNDYFSSTYFGSDPRRVLSAADFTTNVVYWAYADTVNALATPTTMILYNAMDNRFSSATQTCEGLVNSTQLHPFISGFASSMTYGGFSSALDVVADIETGNIEFNPGGFSHLSGAKLLVDQTTNAIVGKSEVTNDLVTVTTAGSITANPVTGFCDFRTETRYHRLRFNISAPFSQAQAIELKAKPSGAR